MNDEPENPNLRTEDYSRHNWKRYLRFLKWYGLALLVITLILVALGYSGAGWEGVKNGLTWGVLLAVLGLPVVGLLISVNVWSGYANRWGESKYKEMLEGKPEDKKYDE